MGQASHLLLSWVQRSTVKLGRTGCGGCRRTITLSAWEVHKAFKVSLAYIMRSSLTDNKKWGEGCVVSLRGTIRRPKDSEIQSCLSGLTQDCLIGWQWLKELPLHSYVEPVLLGAGLMRGWGLSWCSQGDALTLWTACCAGAQISARPHRSPGFCLFSLCWSI